MSLKMRNLIPISRLCNYSAQLWCPALVQRLEPFENGHCRPEKSRKVSFLKTHKTGSR